MSEQATTPRISINKLTDYLTANASKRRRIVSEQKHPNTFRVNWYEPAHTKMCEFLQSSERDEDIIIQEIDRLYALTPSSDSEEARWNSNAEALDHFLDSYEKLNFQGLELRRESNDCPKLISANVEISVRPEFLATGTYRGEEVCGGLKIYFSKDGRLDDTTSKYTAAVLYRYLQDHRSDLGSVKRGFCMVYDVFGEAVFTAPSSNSRRFQDIDAACQEIFLIWPTL